MRPRILLLAATTGYQTRAFEAAAARAGVEIIYATDRCHRLPDPWRDNAIAVRFDEPADAVGAIVTAIGPEPVRGVLALGDAPARLAARVAAALRIPWHGVNAASIATDKLLTRGRLLQTGLPVPWFFSMHVDDALASIAGRLRFPCVVKPRGLTGSRGVQRADDPEGFEAARHRLAAILSEPDLRRMLGSRGSDIVVEGFVEGAEFALEGIVEHGVLRVLAMFDKPVPLEGPVFEETIYVTPSALPTSAQRTVAATVAHAAAAMGLHHGPIHAECRVNAAGVFVLEVAPRPIGGLCARALRFHHRDGHALSLEELLLRHAAGEPLDQYGREAAGSGVLMVPVPRAGRLRHVDGVEQARRIDGIEDVIVSVKPGELVRPLPEASGYLGFIFARSADRAAVIAALEQAHAALTFVIDAAVPLAT
jgi:biotin carboxylase